jgi:hypothetical protein
MVGKGRSGGWEKGRKGEHRENAQPSSTDTSGNVPRKVSGFFWRHHQ